MSDITTDIAEIITEFFDAHPRIEPDPACQTLARIAGVLSVAAAAALLAGGGE